MLEVKLDHTQHAPEATTGSHSPEKKISNFNPKEWMPVASHEWTEEALDHKPQLQFSSPQQLLLLWRLWKIAAHEEAHAHVVRSLGGEVIKRSVVPEGNSGGRTIFRPPFQHVTSKSDVLALCIFYIASAAASEYGEDMIGEHNHGGCRGDRGMIEYYSKVCEIYTGGTYSGSYAESEGRRQSRLALCSLPLNELESRAHDLAEHKERSN